MTFMIVIAVGYLCFRIYMMKLPYPAPPVDPELAPYDGVRGWLIIIIIGLLIRIALNVKSLCTDYSVVWDAGKWNLLTVPGAAQYDPLWAPTLLFELAFTLLFPFLSVLALVLMFEKRKIFPRIMVTILLLALAFKVADAALADQIPLLVKQNGNSSDPDLPRVFLQAIIWVPYMLYARRVRATFRA
jgi:glucan phosphoethanolaminetransferase (alkaline phosphatase superfamily)